MKLKWLETNCSVFLHNLYCLKLPLPPTKVNLDSFLCSFTMGKLKLERSFLTSEKPQAIFWLEHPLLCSIQSSLRLTLAKELHSFFMRSTKVKKIQIFFPSENLLIIVETNKITNAKMDLVINKLCHPKRIICIFIAGKQKTQNIPILKCGRVKNIKIRLTQF